MTKRKTYPLTLDLLESACLCSSERRKMPREATDITELVAQLPRHRSDLVEEVSDDEWEFNPNWGASDLGSRIWPVNGAPDTFHWLRRRGADPRVTWHPEGKRDIWQGTFEVSVVTSEGRTHCEGNDSLGAAMAVAAHYLLAKEGEPISLALFASRGIDVEAMR